MKNVRRDPSEVKQCPRAGKPSLRFNWAALPAAAFCAWAFGVSSASGLALRVPNQDASAIARGNAFVATADNPSAMYYNPSGITQLEGQNIQAGSLFYLGIYGDYHSTSGRDIDNDPEVIPVPTLQYTVTPKEWPVSFGLGVYEPFGFSVKWPDDVPFRQESLKGSLTYITLNPVVAWKALPSLSIGAGPTFNYSRIQLVQGLLPTPLPMFPADQSEFKGDAWSYGFNAGVLWQPHPQWSFGASYRSSSRMDYQGDFNLHDVPPQGASLSASGASSKLDFPQIVIGGVSYRPTKHWNLEFDVDWADWTSVKNLSIQGTPVPVPNRTLDWQSSFMYEFGVTRYFDNGYYLSAGYFYSQASSPTAFFTPMVPDTNLHIGSLGGGYKGKTWSWALALQIIGGGWRNVTVDSSVNQSVNGQYKLFTPTLSFTVGYHF
jgi:long-chain fatty acid transport protein